MLVSCTVTYTIKGVGHWLRSTVINHIIESLEITLSDILEQVSEVMLLKIIVLAMIQWYQRSPAPTNTTHVPPSIGDLHLFLAAKRWVAGDQEESYREKKHFSPPNTHTQIQTQIYPSKYQMVFLESVSIFSWQKKTTPMKHTFCILGYGCIQLARTAAAFTERRVSSETWQQNFINKLMSVAWRTRKPTRR